MRLFVLAKDESGLRAVAVHADLDHAAAEITNFQGRGFEAIGVGGFDLQDVMQSHPAWFEIKGDQ